MGEGFLGIVDVGVGVVVEQHNGFVLGDDANGCYEFLEFVLEHPFVAGQVDQLAGFDVAEQFVGIQALAMSTHRTVLADGALQVLHVALAEVGGIHADALEHLKSLPDALDGGSRDTVGEGYGDAAVGEEGAELHEVVLRLARHIDDHRIRVLSLERFEWFLLGFDDNHRLHC